MPEFISRADRTDIERACERLVVAYTRALDRADMNAAADFFAVNGTLARPSSPGQVVIGREAIRTSLLSRPKSLLTKHLVTNIIIDVESLDRAVGVSSLTLIATTPGALDEPPFLAKGPIYFGEFNDRFVLEEDKWRFAERRGSIQMSYGISAST